MWCLATVCVFVHVFVCVTVCVCVMFLEHYEQFDECVFVSCVIMCVCAVCTCSLCQIESALAASPANPQLLALKQQVLQGIALTHQVRTYCAFPCLRHSPHWLAHRPFVVGRSAHAHVCCGRCCCRHRRSHGCSSC